MKTGPSGDSGHWSELMDMICCYNLNIPYVGVPESSLSVPSFRVHYKFLQGKYSLLNQESCLMPLCPTCICSHLELHLKGGKSNPQFDNINDSLGAISQEIKVFSDKFEEGRSKLVTC